VSWYFARIRHGNRTLKDTSPVAGHAFLLDAATLGATKNAYEIATQ
jgi:hypothetical protein